MHAVNIINPKQARVPRPSAWTLTVSQWALVVGTWLLMILAMVILTAWAGK